MASPEAPSTRARCDVFSSACTTKARLQAWDEAAARHLSQGAYVDAENAVRAGEAACAAWAAAGARAADLAQELNTELLERHVFDCVRATIALHTHATDAVQHVQALQQRFDAVHSTRVSTSYSNAYKTMWALAADVLSDAHQIPLLVVGIQTYSAGCPAGRDAALLGHIMRVHQSTKWLTQQMREFESRMRLHAAAVRAELESCVM